MSAVEEIREQPHPERVRLRFLQAGEDGAVKEARVPAGTTIFDAASWNGVAIDSTCGGHGTCKKCKVKVVSGNAPLSTVDPRAFTSEELRSGWRLACRAATQEDLTVEVPALQTRPKAALVGVGRHVILRWRSYAISGGRFAARAGRSRPCSRTTCSSTSSRATRAGRATRSRSISARPRWSRRCSTSRRGSRRP
jgi:ferredoxin